MKRINKGRIKVISASLALVMIFLIFVSCAPAATESEEEEGELAVELERWQISENWKYGPQAIWGDLLIAGEYIYGSGLEGKYISTYNLQTREKQRLKEIPVDYLFEEPSIYEDKVIWSSVYYSKEARMSQRKDFESLNWDAFLLDLKTGEERTFKCANRA